MNWRLKVAGFKALSALPGGKAFYRFAQKQITGSIRPTQARVNQKIEVGIRYFNWLREHGYRENLDGGIHLDFGAGWHPTIPLLFYSFGIDRQFLFDISPLLDSELVQQTLAAFLSIVGEPRWPHRERLRRLPPPIRNRPWNDYLRELGIEYCAPYGPGWPTVAENVSVVSSTQVLLYIPKPILEDCFAQIYTALGSGGVFLATVDLRNLVAGGHNYNHLRYPNEVWDRWVNSPLMSYNRMRAAEYSELLQEAGFSLAGFDVEPATPEDFIALDKIPVAPCFQRYSREELGAKHLFFAARKP
jgi:hypothetical protein